MKSFHPKKQREDRPIKLILSYQEQIASLLELLDDLKGNDGYDREKLFDIILPHFKCIVPDLSGFAMLGKRENLIKCHAQNNISDSHNDWKTLNRKDVFNALHICEKAGAVAWNEEDNKPEFTQSFSQNTRIAALSWLCEHPDDENIFLLFTRNVEDKPFLVYELQVIKLASGIVGAIANYGFTNQLLKYNIHRAINDMQINETI